MKKIVLLIFVLIGNFLIAQQCEWVRTAGGKNYDEPKSMCIDAEGNVYVAGTCYDSLIYFGDVELSGTLYGGFLAKYNQDGDLLWAHRIDTLTYSYIVENDPSGGILIGLSRTTVSVRKYNSDGQLQWEKSGTQSTTTALASLKCDLSGNIFISGYFRDDFGFGETVLHSKGSDDIFLAKLNNNGDLIWARTEGGARWEWPRGLAIDMNGNAVITGSFVSESLVIGDDTLLNPAKDYNWSYDLFIAKYDPNGNVIWATNGHGKFYNSDEGGGAVAFDKSGDIYLGGYFEGWMLIFGEKDTVRPHSSSSTFIAKFDSDGNFTWCKSNKSGGYSDHISDLKISESGDLYAVGTFAGYNFGFDTVLLNSNGGWDFFVYKFDTNGNVIWGKGVGSNASDGGYSSLIALDQSENVYLAADFNGEYFRIDNYTFFNHDTKGSSSDIFIAKLNQAAVLSLGEDFLSHSSVNIFPNPSTGKFNIAIDESVFPVSNRAVTYEIEDLLGKKIDSGNFSPEKKTIDLSDKPKGIYFVILRNGHNCITKKIIIE
jgi:hypothetical protein